jgi:hypothetical protein
MIHLYCRGSSKTQSFLNKRLKTVKTGGQISTLAAKIELCAIGFELVGKL